MPPAKITCTCGINFLASRKDAKYHRPKCRTKARQEDAKFETPIIPQSGVTGVTYNRIIKRWEVRIKEDKKMKYVGAFKLLKDALRFHKEVTTCPSSPLS